MSSKALVGVSRCSFLGKDPCPFLPVDCGLLGWGFNRAIHSALPKGTQHLQNSLSFPQALLTRDMKGTPSSSILSTLASVGPEDLLL